jgi:predicted metal-binding transcription factor (methanogenesis marker protein 9)
LQEIPLLNGLPDDVVKKDIFGSGNWCCGDHFILNFGTGSFWHCQESALFLKKCSKTEPITLREEELETFEVSQREIIEFDRITIQILKHSR